MVHFQENFRTVWKVILFQALLNKKRVRKSLIHIDVTLLVLYTCFN